MLVEVSTCAVLFAAYLTTLLIPRGDIGYFFCPTIHETDASANRIYTIIFSGSFILMLSDASNLFRWTRAPSYCGSF